MKKITLLITLLFVIQFSIAQDSCAGAIPITTAGFYTVGAINGAPPSLICADNGAIPATRPPGAEWYAYTPTANYTVTVTTDLTQNTSGIDTRVHVYTGNCGALTCYAGDDDAGTYYQYSSIVTFNVTAGTTYIIAFDNRWNSLGFTFQLVENAIVVPVPAPVTYTNQVVSTINSTHNKCVVDMNGDHKDDIVGVGSGYLKVHNQEAGGTFSISNFTLSGTSKMPTWSMAAGDYNRDGYNDLVLGAGDGLSIWRSQNNSGVITYSPITPGEYIFCQRTNFVDINNDGNLDIFSCHDVNRNVYYLNNASNNLTYYQSGVTPGAYNLGLTASGGNYASLWTDFDNDGDVDMFISKCSGPPCELHRNDGNGVFTDISAIAQINPTPVQSWSSAVADFDNDGDMDILIGSNGSTAHKFFRNNLDLTNSTEEAYSEITIGSGWDTDTTINRDYIAYDFDNNGLIDVMGSANKIMFNQGNNVFSPVTYTGLGISVGGVGDLNNDGFLDIVNGSTIHFATPNGNNWLKVALDGVQSNKNGIGARVEIYGPWGKQIRDIRSGEGFAYMSTLNAHFGLGTSTIINQVLIHWPSGIVDTYNNVTPNQQLLVVEGATLSLIKNENNSVFSIYPNPAKNVINIQINTMNVEFLEAKIYDLTGKKVLDNRMIDNKINVESLSKGTYILVLKDTDGKSYSQKIIKE